ncbi:MAG: hypothetical protein IT437_08010 [Phycisphaerales bacterium]|nr:hypothetical protein [Phycisphaerales bacterium]
MRNHILGTSLAIALCAAANADVQQFRLSDHGLTAGGHEFGIRFDNLFNTHNSANSGFGGQSGGFTTFSLSRFGDTVMTVSQEGGTLTISIHGTVDGGRATGSGYIAGLGRGSYELGMTYTANILQGPNGWRVSAPSVQNSGFIRAMSGVTGIAAGTTWSFGDRAMAPASNSLTFFKYGATAVPVWTGTGWLLAPSPTVGYQQAMFTGTMVPLPPGAALGGVGLAALGGVCAVRRRRRATDAP